MLYLAGPDVFFSEPVAIGASKKAICAKYGFSGRYPLDNEIVGLLPGSPASGFQISRLNEALIGSCDMLVANLTPFRGVSADPGTVYELGYAAALGKAVHGYSCTSTLYAARLRALDPGTGDIDSNGFHIENFGLTDNLMIEGAIHSRDGIFLAREGENLVVFESLIRALADRS
jgi:nucleoside 2-deoxyribosyltransferase